MPQTEPRWTSDQHAADGIPHDHPASVEARSLGALIKEIRDEIILLFQQEVALAKTEISEKTSRIMRNVAMMAAAGVLALSGLTVLLIGVGNGLALALEVAGLEEHAFWLGPLLVGLAVLIIGGVMAMSAKKSLQEESIVPETTAQSLKENKEWVKSKTT